MNRVEFGKVLAFLSAGCGKALTHDAAEVYFDLLGDLPAAALQGAAKRSLLEAAYPAFPSIATLRKLATEAMTGTKATAAEAWDLVCKSVSRHGLSGMGRALASLPAAAARTAQAIGWRQLCDARVDDMDTIRAHFLRAYEQVAERERREALLPVALKQALEAIGIVAQAAELDNRSGREILAGVAGQIGTLRIAP